MNITVSVPPDDEPVTVEEAMAWSRIDDAAEGAVLESIIKRAREEAESILQRALLTQTIVQRYDCFPYFFEMRSPVASVTTLQYIDTAGTLQTIDAANYWVDLYSEPARLVPTSTYSWPMVQLGRPNAVVLTYVAGWASADLVPETIRGAILKLVDHWYENRDAVDVPLAIRNLLWPHRIP